MNLYASDSPNIAQDLFPNLYTFIAHLIAMLIILFFLIFYAWKPLKSFLKKRNSYITENINVSERERKISEDNKRKSTEALVQAKVEAVKIVEESKLNAQSTSDELVNNAKKKAQIELDTARNEIIKNRLKNESMIKKQIVDVSILLSEKLLKRELSEKDNQVLINNFIDELEKGDK